MNTRRKDNEELIAGLKRLAEELRRIPKCYEVNRCPYTASIWTYYKRFGSWNEALKQAGLSSYRRISMGKQDNEELIAGLKRLAEELGRVPKYYEVNRCPYTASISTYHNRFGSWNEALKQAGLSSYRRINMGKQDNEELIAGLKRLAEELGRVPKCYEVNRCPYTASIRTYYRRFGNYQNALRLAGLLDEN